VVKKSESRSKKRIRFVFPIRVGILDNTSETGEIEYFHAFSDNISEGGLKIPLQKDIPVNTKLRLRFDLIIKDEIHIVETIGLIKWVKNKKVGPKEYGITFESLSTSGWRTVERFMKEYCAR